MKALAQPIVPDNRVEEREPEPAQTQAHANMDAALKFAADWSRFRLACAGGGGLYRVGPEKR